jgi:hypothetical protein
MCFSQTHSYCDRHATGINLFETLLGNGVADVSIQCGICGGQSGAGTVFCAVTSVSAVCVIPLSLVYRGQYAMLATDSVLR